jgi:hypothetical protein
MSDEKIKIYYKKDTGFLCSRYPYDLTQEDGDPYIEVTPEKADETFICEAGYSWAVSSGSLVKKVYDSEEADKEALAQERRSLIIYLSSTDYIIAKFTEAIINGEDYSDMKSDYKEQLEKRAEARKRINDIDNLLK